MDDSVYLMQLIMQHSMYCYFCYFIAIWMTLLGKKKFKLTARFSSFSPQNAHNHMEKKYF